jgi:hypothetical protein
MSELKNRGYILSQNKWETRQGASSFFAPGSVIDDQYLLLSQRVERSFILIWNAPQPFSLFAEQMLTLSLEDNQAIAVKLPPSVWLEGNTQQRNNVTEFVVYNAVREGDVTQLKAEGLSGNGRNLQLKLSDSAEQSKLIATQFKIKYRTTRYDPRFRPVSDYTSRYEGQVSPELVNLNDNRFTLNLGELPIPPEYLKPGLGVEVEVIATRSFAGYSKEQKIIVRDVIPGLQ